MQIHDPAAGQTYWYDRFRPDMDEPYAPRLPSRACPDADGDEEMVYEDENEEGDTVERVGSGVRDIIITGEVRYPFSLPPFFPRRGKC